MANARKQNKPPPGQLHPRNPHAGRYDFDALSRSCLEIESYLRPSPTGDQTIDFADPAAVLCLNRALLAHHYEVRNWQIPPGYLCPPIPGRADYIHYLADLLEKGRPPKDVRVLDIGTGSSCIYPIIGQRSYGWSFVGTDVDPIAIQAAEAVLRENPSLQESISLRRQPDRKRVFQGIVGEAEHFDLSMCNPPFFGSAAEARESNTRKVRKLAKGKGGARNSPRNFGGQSGELWCEGGELGFLNRMISESAAISAQVGWFTSLVSRRELLAPLKKRLALIGAQRVEIVEMAQGQKRSRFLAWRFGNGS